MNIENREPGAEPEVESKEQIEQEYLRRAKDWQEATKEWYGVKGKDSSWAAKQRDALFEAQKKQWALDENPDAPPLTLPEKVAWALDKKWVEIVEAREKALVALESGKNPDEIEEIKKIDQI